MGAVFFLIFIAIVAYIIYSINQTSKQKQQSKQRPQVSVSVEYGSSGSNYRENNLESDPEKFWIPKDEEVKVHGFKLDGMVYVGENLEASTGYSQLEPSLINPELKIAKNKRDPNGETFGYWPSYHELDPPARATYLEWLANGKNNPDVDIGYVFLYFYGLERRFLVDLKSKDVPEKQDIIEEVRRLKNVYGSINSSFANYAQGLIDWALLDEQSESIPPEEPPSLEDQYDFPFEFKKGLADYAVSDTPLPANWAFTWAVNHSEVKLLTPAKRCEEKFKELFKKLYQDRYGEGKKLRVNKTKLSINYNPASRSVSRGYLSRELDLPDLTALTKPINEFREIIEEATQKLDPYSRYLGRNSDSEGEFEALTQLPAELLEDHDDERLEKLRDYLKSVTKKNDFSLAEVNPILEPWDLQENTSLRKNEIVPVTQFLSKMGYGVEPDPRFGSPKFDPNGEVVFFDIDSDEAPETPTKEYKLTVLAIQLTAVVAMADGVFSKNEQAILESFVEKVFSLTDEEIKRLKAFLFWLKGTSPHLKGVKRKVNKLDDHKKKSLLSLLVDVAKADGKIDPQEVEALTTIYEKFEFEVDDLYQKLHQLKSDSGPQWIIEGDEDSEGFDLPEEVESTEDVEEKDVIDEEGVELDRDDIQKTLEDTEEVQSILTDIFEDEDEEQPEEISKSEDQETPESDKIIPGLDEPHSKLLGKLIENDSWDRMEYEQLCSEVGLFPDGALEVINEEAFEIFEDDLLIEDGEIHINHSVLEESKV